MDLSIIIVNWNVRPLLERCLRSIYAKTHGLVYEVIVVDNASQDDSRDFLKEFAKTKSNFKVIFNEKNLGFARANNQALRQASGKYILCLNPDTEIVDNSLAQAVEFMDRNKKCGIMGCRLVGVDNITQPSVRSFPTIKSQILILLKLHHLLPNLPPLRDYFIYDFNYNLLQEVDQVMGAFLLTRREIIDQIGFFDENFFLWFEEVDFCKRVKEKGWAVIYNPEIKVIHFGHQCFKQVLSFDKQKIYNRSLLYYFEKHFSKKACRLLKGISIVSLFLAFLIQFFSVHFGYKKRQKVYYRGI